MNEIKKFEELYVCMNTLWTSLHGIAENGKCPHGNLSVMCYMLNTVEKLEKVLRILNKVISRILPKLENTYDITDKEKLDMSSKLMYIKYTNEQYSTELEEIKKALKNGGDA